MTRESFMARLTVSLIVATVLLLIILMTMKSRDDGTISVSAKVSSGNLIDENGDVWSLSESFPDGTRVVLKIDDGGTKDPADDVIVKIQKKRK